MNNLRRLRKLILQTTRPITDVQPCVLCSSMGLSICCEACQKDLPRLPQNLCPQCALPLRQETQCSHCQTSQLAFDRTFAAFSFDNPVNHLVHALKYQGNLILGVWFAEQLTESVMELHQHNPISAVIGMPLHPLRIAERGFNQSHEIAKHLAAKIRVPCLTNICHRLHHRPPQVELQLRERLQLPDGLFDCRADFDGLHILLVDDVMTTGASLNQLAIAVKRQGAHHVTCGIVARAHSHLLS